MTIAVSALAIAVLGLTFVVIWAVVTQSSTLSGREVTVNTRRPDDQTIRGVVVRDTARWLVLRGATYITPEAETPIDGPSLRIPQSNVAFVQER